MNQALRWNIFRSQVKHLHRVCSSHGTQVYNRRMIARWVENAEDHGLACMQEPHRRGFLGTIWIFIEDFAKHAKPVIQLTRKDVKIKFSKEQILAMERLKTLIRGCTAIKALDYSSDREVILAVDLLWIAVRFIL